MDYAVWPILFLGPLITAIVMLQRGVSAVLVTIIPTTVLVIAAFVLERVRPEHEGQTAPDQPVINDIGHFIALETAYFIAVGLCYLVHQFVSVSLWPTHWPFVCQLILAVVIYEGFSYWQHRWFHHHKRVWAFHALHHWGPHLNLPRGVRFHAVDLALPTLMGYLPLVVVNAPDSMVTMLGVVITCFGITQHANVRQRTPRWLDFVLCTPVMHRQHHGLAKELYECNYGTTVMLWDHLFGTFRPAKTPDGPTEIGIENDADVPAGFWSQLGRPFRDIFGR